MQGITKNPKRVYSSKDTGGNSAGLVSRITNLENNEYKVTYYEIISGASGSLTVPTGATINAGEFGLSGNAVLSKINGSNKPTFETPTTSGGTLVTASLNTVTGAWVASGVYTDPFVALIYSVRIKAVDYVNLNYNNIIETADDTDLALKSDKTSWIDISATVTVTGFSGTPTVSFWYKISDGIVVVLFNITGTSNSTIFTVDNFPFTLNASQPLNYSSCRVTNNGAASATSGRVRLDPLFNYLVVQKDLSGTPFTASGTKASEGQIMGML